MVSFSMALTHFRANRIVWGKPSLFSDYLSRKEISEEEVKVKVRHKARTADRRLYNPLP
jgi:hypothetical protein